MSRIPYLCPAVGVLVSLVTRFPAASAQERSRSPSGSRECAVCHLQWVGDFSETGAVVLAEPPLEDVVAEADTCLGCHDGSVADSRQLVWQEHGHATGVIPPETMHVPAQLPLQHGRITCRTCHSAHPGDEPETLATAVVVRTVDAPGGLCVACHAGYADGPAAGSHPLGELPWKIPTPLAEAGARGGPDGRTMSCLTCHTPHGSRRDHLLIAPVQPSRACLACHERLDPARWSAEMVDKHHPIVRPPEPRDPGRLAAEEADVTPDANLGCLVCHKMHQSPSAEDLLVRPSARGQLCIYCHKEQQGVIATPHDLTLSAPDLPNALGTTAAKGGPCSVCHAVHATSGPVLWAATAAPATGPADLCTGCHRSGGLAAAKTGGELRHPGGPFTAQQIKSDTSQFPLFDRQCRRVNDGLISCATCHDVHASAASAPAMLRGHEGHGSWAWCGECHRQSDTLALSLHAEKSVATLVPDDRSSRQTAYCGPCHAVHARTGAPATGMWAGPTSDNAPADTRHCLGCHGPDGSAEGVQLTFHPNVPMRNPTTAESPSFMPLVDDNGTPGVTGRISCLTCHQPHGRPPGRGLPELDPRKVPDRRRSALESMIRPYIVPNLCSGCHGLQGLQNYLYYHLPGKRQTTYPPRKAAEARR